MKTYRVLAKADDIGRVYEQPYSGPRCFADKGYYDQVARVLDALEEKAIKRLRSILTISRDMLIAKVMRGSLPNPRDVHLSKLPDFRRGVRDLLETASLRGGRDAKAEVREMRKRVRVYHYPGGQDHDQDKHGREGNWTAGAYAPGGKYHGKLNRMAKVKGTTLTALASGFNAASIKKNFGDEADDIIDAIERHSASTKIPAGDRAMMDKLYTEMGVELKQDTLLYRGLDLPNDVIEQMEKATATGKSVLLKNHADRYVPTSTSRIEAQDFGEDTGKRGKVLLEVVAPKGARVLPIGRLNGYGEKEIALDRGAQFRVVAVETKSTKIPEWDRWPDGPTHRTKRTFRVELVKSVHQDRGEYTENNSAVFVLDEEDEPMTLTPERFLHFASDVVAVEIDGEPLNLQFTQVREHAAPAVFRPRNAMKWMREKEFYVTDLLDKAITSNVRGILVNGLKTGELNGAVADKIWTAFEKYIGDPNVLKDGEPLSPARLETIVRTNLTDAYNHGRMMEYTSDEMITFIDAIRYSAILDERTTPVCAFLDGKLFSPMDPDLTDLLPPNHFNCRSLVVPVVVGEAIDQDDFITPEDVGKARSLADAKFLSLHTYHTPGGQDHDQDNHGNEGKGIGPDGYQQNEWVTLDPYNVPKSKLGSHNRNHGIGVKVISYRNGKYVVEDSNGFRFHARVSDLSAPKKPTYSLDPSQPRDYEPKSKAQ